MPLKSRLYLVVAITCGAALAAGSQASAQTATDTLSVQVTVQNSCSVGGTTIDFGTYSSGQSSDLDADGDLTYSNCPAGTLTVSLDAGGSGNISNRQMSSGNGDNLSYQLYKNSARNQVWGADAEGLQQVLLEAGSGSMTVYGRIVGNQDAPAGQYSDVVNITMTF
jgi:spore coat protein U-like protein